MKQIDRVDGTDRLRQTNDAKEGIGMHEIGARRRGLLAAAPVAAALGAALLGAPAGAHAAVGDLSGFACTTGAIPVGPTGTGACAAIPSATVDGQGSGHAGISAVATSPDGRSLYAGSITDDAIARYERNPSTGDLTYKGCITGNSDLGPGGTSVCAEIPSATSGGAGSGLSGPATVVVSPDGASVYVVAANDDSVARFNRNATSGTLTYQSCISGDFTITSGGVCNGVTSPTAGGTDSGFDGPFSAAVSADGKSLYVAAQSDDAIARFNRLAGGSLVYQDCVTGETESGTSTAGPCTEIPGAASGGAGSGLDFPAGVTVSPDGDSVYVPSPVDHAVSRFDRDANTGALTYQDCTAGDSDLGPGGTNVCEEIPSATSGGAGSGLSGVFGVAASPDSASLYTVAQNDDAVGRFDRSLNPGALTYQGCITGDSDLGPGGTGVCAAIPTATSGGVDAGLDAVDRLAVSPDGRSLYVGAVLEAAVATFDRNTSSGALSYDRCITGKSSAGPMPPGSGACAGVPAIGPGGQAGLTLGFPGTMEVSADGRSLYASVLGDAAVAGFDRETPPSPPPAPGPSADTTAPSIALRGKKTQKGAKVVKVKVMSNEAATVVGSGTIKVPVVQGSASTAKSKKSKLKKQTRSVAAGQTVTVTLKLKKKARKLTKKAHRKRKNAKATVKVVATDAAGNKSTAKRKVKLKKN